MSRITNLQKERRRPRKHRTASNGKLRRLLDSAVRRIARLARQGKVFPWNIPGWDEPAELPDPTEAELERLLEAIAPADETSTTSSSSADGTSASSAAEE